jgi:hypothetical protein
VGAGSFCFAFLTVLSRRGLGGGPMASGGDDVEKSIRVVKNQAMKLRNRIEKLEMEVYKDPHVKNW